MDPSGGPWRAADSAEKAENQRCPTQQCQQPGRMTKQRTQHDPSHREGGEPGERGKLAPEAEHLVQPDQGAGRLGRCGDAFDAPLRDPVPHGEPTLRETG